MVAHCTTSAAVKTMTFILLQTKSLYVFDIYQESDSTLTTVIVSFLTYLRGVAHSITLYVRQDLTP